MIPHTCCTKGIRSVLVLLPLRYTLITLHTLSHCLTYGRDSQRATELDTCSPGQSRGAAAKQTNPPFPALQSTLTHQHGVINSTAH